MKLDAYVNYPGTCEAAFRFYERELGGRITLLTLHEDQPNQASAPADWTFFANRFAMLRDRFGTSWMLLHEAGPDRKR